jgi:hypothetical protein
MDMATRKELEGLLAQAITEKNEIRRELLVLDKAIEEVKINLGSRQKTQG